MAKHFIIPLNYKIYCMNERFTNKIAVVTGSGSGIGKGIAYRLGHERATLLLIDNNKEALECVVNDCKKLGMDSHGYLTDISDEAAVSATISAIEAKWGRIDVMVHAAGIVGPTSTKITEYPVDAFDTICNINLRGTFLITKHTLQVMAKKGTGRVLLLASIAGKEGNPGMVGYSSTKAGVIGLVKGVAKEFATTNITVNGLAPAVIKTTMNENTQPEQLAYMVAKIPMSRLGTVEEVAAMACFIVSDENSFSTGFIYDISGAGLLIRCRLYRIPIFIFLYSLYCLPYENSYFNDLCLYPGRNGEWLGVYHHHKKRRPSYAAPGGAYSFQEILLQQLCGLQHGYGVGGRYLSHFSG